MHLYGKKNFIFRWLVYEGVQFDAGPCKNLDLVVLNVFYLTLALKLTVCSFIT